MATITIKIDAEFIKQLGLRASTTEEPALITTATDLSPKPALTATEVFEFLRSKGETLEEACKNHQDLGDFFASFTTLPEKRIESDIEPLDSTSIGAALEPEADDFNAYEAAAEKAKEQSIIYSNTRSVIRTCAMGIADDGMRYQYLLSQSCDPTRVTRLVAEILLFEFIANRGMREDLIRGLKERNLYLFDKLKDYKEPEFFARYLKGDGV